jgi:NAD(P)-dependent dehydrogenase (short-subunit alcohol dehydrogenase family)
VAADFIAKGANIVLFDILPEDKGVAFAASLDPKKVLYIKTDITNSDDTKAAVQKVVDIYGNLKGLIHCAGIAKKVFLANSYSIYISDQFKRAWTNDLADSIDDFKLMLNVNTVGVRASTEFL